MGTILHAASWTTDRYTAKEPELYNALILDNYIQMIKENYPEADVFQILEDTGLQEWEVSDPGRWFTQSQVTDLYRQITKRCKPKTDVSIAREAGRYAAGKSAKKIMRQAALSFISLGYAYDCIGKLANKYTRHANWVVKKRGKNCREIIVNFKSGLNPSPHQCDNAIGSIEAIALGYTEKLPKLEHPECFFKGGNACRYIISWEDPPSGTIKRVRNYVSAIGSLVALLLVLNSQILTGITTLIGFAIGSLILSLTAEAKEKDEIIQTYKSLNIEADDYLLNYYKYFNTAQLVGKISKHLARHTSTDKVLVKLGEILVGLGFKRGMVLFIGRSASDMNIDQAFVYNDLAFEKIDNLIGVPLDIDKSNELSKPRIIGDIAFASTFLPDDIIDHLKRSRYDRPLYVPITFESVLLGFFIIEGGQVTASMTTGDINLLRAMASQIGLFMTNISALDAVMQSERTKNEFVTVASHEMRTPIQMVLMALDELKYSLGSGALDDEAVQGALDILEEGIGRLSHIANNMLDLSKLEKQKANLDIQTVRATEIKTLVEREIRYLIARKKHTLKLVLEPKSLEINCDVSLLTQVLINLVDNSAKYTISGGTIVVIMRKRKTAVDIRVIDNGPGIPKDEQEKVFVKFYHIERDKEKQIDERSCGLGLSFCREIVRQHGGLISVQSPVYGTRAETELDVEFGINRPGTQMLISIPHC